VTRIRAARAAGIGLLLAAVLAGCGGLSAAERQARNDRFNTCLRQRSAAAVYRFVASAYREGRLGGPEQIRKDFEVIRRSKDPPPIRSFLRPDGTLVPMRSMDLIQWGTFSTWLFVPRVAAIGHQAEQAGVDARLSARDDCKQLAKRA
jgi:hypothetical protein